MKKRIYTNETIKKEGEIVTLAGWVDARRDHGKLIFLDLRDREGIIQIVITPKNKALYEITKDVRDEWVIQVTGKVQKRPNNMLNAEIETGAFEIPADELIIISKAKTPPFELNTDGYEISEEIRMKYRYIDLRRKRLHLNMKMRHEAIQFMRNYLSEKKFIEIETPLLSKSTPEGARDYLVPSRQHPGQFYALPQSPQQYKQLLMVAGFEKYFQIARALRDEDTRGDRQPEHTQLDIEISFTTPVEVMELIEGLFTKMIKELYPHKIMELPWPKISYQKSMEKYGTDKPDMRKNKKNKDEMAFVWIVDFPQFELDSDKNITPVHHMFVQPADDSVNLIDTEPLKMVSTQYDLVCNGYELASGSIRIHDSELQEKIMKVIGISKKDARKKFGHMLDAFKYGAPQHGGIAPGIDRLLMILQNEPNIREVIAFPKTGDGRDLMMDAPAEVSKNQLDELSIKIIKSPTKQDS